MEHFKTPKQLQQTEKENALEFLEKTESGLCIVAEALDQLAHLQFYHDPMPNFTKDDTCSGILKCISKAMNEEVWQYMELAQMEIKEIKEKKKPKKKSKNKLEVVK